MIETIAIENYRSILKLIIPLDRLNVVTGPNGSGKSNLYKALSLLARAGRGSVVESLAIDGGLDSAFWAGQSKPNDKMPIVGEQKPSNNQLRLGFSSDSYSYSVAFGRPEYEPRSTSMFLLDPGIVRESIWPAGSYRPQNALVERKNNVITLREGRHWKVISNHISTFDSLFEQVSNIESVPEIYLMKERMRQWRFYDHFRTDRNAPARQSQLGSRSPVLYHDGRNLAAAIQTILETGDPDALIQAIDHAFPGAYLTIRRSDEGIFSLAFHQKGLLRPLSVAELSDGTLRYILWVAALLTPRPPELMVLNEPETSLHPDLIPSLARLILYAAERSQVWVVSHSDILTQWLEDHGQCNSIRLEKYLGQTQIPSLERFDIPVWHWPS